MLLLCAPTSVFTVATACSCSAGSELLQAREQSPTTNSTSALHHCDSGGEQLQSIASKKNEQKVTQENDKNLYQSQVRAPYSNRLLSPFLHPARSHDAKEELADTLYSIVYIGNVDTKYWSLWKTCIDSC